MKKTIENNPSTAKLVVVGAGIASLATAAYFFLGSNGKNIKNKLEIGL